MKNKTTATVKATAKKEKKAAPHIFGKWIIPDDARLTLRESIKAESEYAYVPNMYAWIDKEQTKLR